MKIGTNVDKYHSFINCQFDDPQARHLLGRTKPRPAVTISRQSGAGAMAIAEELATFLQAHTPAPSHWMVFDKNLADKVLEEHQLPKEIAKFMPEDRKSAIQDAVEELLGLHPSARTLLQLTTETILHLAEIGHVILIGRAGNVITRHMRTVFHVRLIAPLDQRVANVMARSQLAEKAALEFIHKADRGRQHYLKTHFGTDIDDNLQYDLVINTARIPKNEVVHLIGEAIRHWAATL